MKKIAFIMAVCVMLTANINVVFAEPIIKNIEIIQKETPSKCETKTHNWWTGKEFTERIREENSGFKRLVSDDGIHFKDSGLPSNLAEKDTLLWFNGVYILLDCNDYVPNKFFDTIGYTAPFYILDENFNVIKEVDYPGRIICCAIENGEFCYITQKRTKREEYGSIMTRSSFEYVYNKTSDFENITKFVIGGDYLYNYYSAYKRYFKKNNNILYETDKLKYAYVGYNIYSWNYSYSFDGVYFYDALSIQDDMPDLADYGWYKDGFLYVEEENDYLKIQVDKPNDIYIMLNGKILAFDQPPVVEDGRTLVPMRFLFECLGDKVTWDEETRSVTAENKNSAVTFSLDSLTADVNGTEQTMDVPAKLIGDKTYVPLRFLSENLGYTVTWNEETSTASIVSDPAKITQNTDIQCTINGLWIESFAIGGNQYIPLDVLSNYGLSITYTGSYSKNDEYLIERDLNVPFTGWNTNKGKTNGNMNVSDNTKIDVLLNGKETNTYLVNQRLVMQADELLALGSGGYNPKTRCFEIQIP